MSAPDISLDERLDAALRRASFALMEARNLAIISRDPNADEIHSAERAVDQVRDERALSAQLSGVGAQRGGKDS